MLRYSIRIDNKKSEYTEIQYQSLYLSPDLSFISGVTSTEYGLVNRQNIYLYANAYQGYVAYPIEIKTVTRRGYVIYTQPYPIQTTDDGESYIHYIDGKNYIITSGKVTINQMIYDSIDVNSGYANIPTKYYVEDGVITIQDVSYNVDFDMDQPSILLRDGDTLFVQNYNQIVNINQQEIIIPNIKEVVHFTIRKSLNYQLSVEDVYCAKNYPHILYGDMLLYLIKIGEQYYVSGYTNDDCIMEECTYNPSSSINEVFFKDNRYELLNEWRNVEIAPQMHFYCDSSELYYESGQVILARPISPQIVYLRVKMEGNKSYVTYHGTNYYINSTVLFARLEDDREVELFKTLNDYYFVVNNVSYAVIVNGNECTTITEFVGSEKTYSITTYPTVVIEGDRYIVKNGQVEILDKYPFRLIVESVTNGNQLLCYVDCLNDISGLTVTSKGTIMASQFLTRGGYSYELYNPLFDDGLVAPKNDIEQMYANITYRIFNDQRYLTIPLIPSSNVGFNLQQEDIVNNEFVNKEKSNAINRIIDMERDIYYPAYRNPNSGNEFNLIDKLVFDLHFLTRDKSTWKIRQDLSYNLYDYYDWGDNNGQLAVSNAIDGFYPPSDLIHCLNFSNNDVFYQKLKIEKSFLRLSFYNSKDPNTQQLLHTSSIFINEGEWYQKYIDHIECDTNYINIDWVDERERSNTINVKYDTYDDNSESVTMDENARLSCRFTVCNRYTSTESSEGFYLYIFREYADGLRPQDIYMKVEFNHAGEGKTINFMLPFKKDGDNISLLNVRDDKDLIKNGVSLNELYDHLFIPLHAIYNESLKKYVYYLPDWLTRNSDKKSVMKLSLFEVKIKDESN